MANTFEQYEEQLTQYLLKTVHHTNRLAPEVQLLKPEVMLQTMVISDLLDEIRGLRGDITTMKEELKEVMNKKVVEEVTTVEETPKGKNKAK